MAEAEHPLATKRRHKEATFAFLTTRLAGVTEKDLKEFLESYADQDLDPDRVWSNVEEEIRVFKNMMR